MPKSQDNIANNGNHSLPSTGRAGEGSSLVRRVGVRGLVEGVLIFLKRIRHCAGFGVQSPTDYAFVREVIYERWPYAQYAELEAKFYGTSRFLLKLSQLLLRVANYAQASRIGIIGPLPPVMEAHLKAGCRKSEIERMNRPLKSPCVGGLPLPTGSSPMQGERGEGLPPSLVIATELNDDWKAYISQEHIISFDLYYLGIAFYDEKRYREEHIINFY